MGIWLVGFKISEVFQGIISQGIVNVGIAEPNSQVEEIPQKKLNFTLLVTLSRSEVPLKRPPECFPFPPLTVHSGVKVRMVVAVVLTWKCPLRASKKLFVEFYYPSCADKETDWPGQRKWRPVSSISWLVTLNFLLTSAGVATAPSDSVSKLVTRWQRLVHLEAPDQ